MRNPGFKSTVYLLFSIRVEQPAPALTATWVRRVTELRAIGLPVGPIQCRLWDQGFIPGPIIGQGAGVREP